MIKEKLEKKFIDFEGGQILGVKDENNIVWLAVRKAIRDIGLSDGQARRQVENLKKDIVLNKGVANLCVPLENGSQETLCLKEDYVTLWLAKISLTPTMQKENPEAVDKLVKYQLHCAKVLHSAFFETENQKEKLFDDLGLEGKIVNLESKIDAQTGELKATQDKLNTLIDNSTINSRQASRLLIHAKDRVGTILGGAHSAEYRKNSRTYFKNLWNAVAEQFEVSTYKDLNPLHYSSCVEFINGWSFR